MAKRTMSRFDKTKVVWICSIAAILILILTIIFISFYISADRRIRTEKTKEGIERAWTEILLIANETGDYPEEKVVRLKLQSVNLGTDAFDAWGNRVKYRINEKFVELRSFGPDGVRSDDDIVVSSRDRKANFGPRPKNPPKRKPKNP